MVVGFGTNNNGVLGMKFLDKFKALLRATPTSASHFVLVVFCSELVTETSLQPAVTLRPCVGGEARLARCTNRSGLASDSRMSYLVQVLD
jgi:hypothetical protein